MTKQDLISDIISNKLSDVFHGLYKILARDPALLEELVMLQSRYNHITSDNNKGIVKANEYNIELNKVKVGILSLINRVDHILDKDQRDIIDNNGRAPYIQRKNDMSSDEDFQLSIIENPKLLLVTADIGTMATVDEEDRKIMTDISKSINLNIHLLTNANVTSFTDQLLYHKYDVVQLNVYNIGLNNGILLGEERISFDAVIKLLKLADVKLLILASCDSVAFAVKLNGVVNMIAGTGGLGMTEFQHWEQVFFKLLLSGKKLSESFELSTSLVELSICLMLSKDLQFIQSV